MLFEEDGSEGGVEVKLKREPEDDSPNVCKRLKTESEETELIYESGDCSDNSSTGSSSREVNNKPKEAKEPLSNHVVENGEEEPKVKKEPDPDNDQVLTNLESEISSLGNLLKLKEKEWNSILRLKKIKEIIYERIKRDIDLLADRTESFSDLKTLLAKVAEEKRSMGPGACQVKTSIEKTERDISDTETFLKKGTTRGEFKASLALQQLSERNRKEGQKVIGEGRQGPIVEVRSIIADYNRSKGSEEGGKSKKGCPSPEPMLQSNIRFAEILISLAKLSQEGGGAKCRSLPAVNPTKGPLSTTLAKLLSSSTAPRSVRSDDSSHSSSKVMPQENSLSLANLLASAKSRDRDSELRDEEEETVPLCQGCNNNRAQFVCAGCSSQWYCSRDCQIAAWDEHSEICSG